MPSMIKLDHLHIRFLLGVGIWVPCGCKIEQAEGWYRKYLSPPNDQNTSRDATITIEHQVNTIRKPWTLERL